MNEEKFSTVLFIGLVFVTLVSVGASRLHLGSGMAVTVALAFAAFKAFLIGWYFMRLKTAGAVPRGAVIVGVLAVLILAFGIFPDVGLFNR
ncbi:MAG: cytochrome C oxidase subunit IV family protein [Elusimicrobia bacterium]|nr:cytochrome C oxidase subunit IV family protein [Elusimicrobiota bacterium]